MRLFYALKINAEDLPALTSAQVKLKRDAKDKDWDIQFTPQSNFHVTLRFLGEHPETQIPHLCNIGRACAQNHEVFELKISDMDAFSDIHQARVIWTGVQNKKNLQALYEDLENQLSSLNLATTTEPFVPHLTLARLKNPRSVKSFISPFVRKKFGQVKCSEIGLFKSELRGNYPHYEMLYTFPLKAATIT